MSSFRPIMYHLSSANDVGAMFIEFGMAIGGVNHCWLAYMCVIWRKAAEFYSEIGVFLHWCRLQSRAPLLSCLRSSSTPKRSSGHRSALFHARGTSCWTAQRVRAAAHNLIPMINLLQAYTLEGEWHELETKRERARSGRKIKAVHRLFIML